MTQLPQSTESLHSILSIQPGEVIIGQLVQLDETGHAWVDYPRNPTHHALSALTTIPLSPNRVGREVALLFAEGDLSKPVIIGLIHVHTELPTETSTVAAKLDGERIVLSAKQAIVLKCGKASITLTRAGKVIIRGAYLLSRSSGVNRIKGGSVQMN
jgi:hypothetical protein